MNAHRSDEYYRDLREILQTPQQPRSNAKTNQNILATALQRAKNTQTTSSTTQKHDKNHSEHLATAKQRPGNQNNNTHYKIIKFKKKKLSSEKANLVSETMQQF